MMASLAQFTSSHMSQRASKLWVHVPTCTIFNASCLSWCIKIDNVCYVEHHSIVNMHAMFKQQHHMPSHWKYNFKNAPTYERKWGIDLVWKWQHGVHMFNFETFFVNFEKDPTMVATMCCALYFTQMMDVMIFSTKWQRDIGIRCMNNSNLEYISIMVQFARGGHLSNVFNMENCPWMYGNLLRLIFISMVDFFMR